MAVGLWLLAALAAGPALAQEGADTAAKPAKGKAKAADTDSGNFVLVDRVVAVVNDTIILESELDARMLPLMPGLQNIEDPRERARRQRKLREQMLDDLVSEELTIQAAREAKLAVEAREVQAALDEVKRQNNLDDDGLASALAQQGYTVQSYRQEVERRLLHLRAVNMLVRPRVTVTDEDVRARYDAMSRRSAAVSKVRLQHILIALPESRTSQEVASGKARAAEIIEQVKAGADFGELAQRYSDDTATKASGGDLGWIERGSIATEWEVIVFSMDEGEVRGPISGPRGLHVFYVSELARTDLAPFDELREQLRGELYRDQLDKETVAWIEDLRKQAYIDRKL
ncbi:MAG: hypothetical protein Tsb0020_46620 [Haliangiales bacterium]